MTTRPLDAFPDFPVRQALAVRLVVLDVDGVLTDAGVYLGADGDGRPVELKRFDIQDGLGVKLLRQAGGEVALVSGRYSAATEIRARELGIRECHQDNGAQKVQAIAGILDRLDLGWENVAMVADDLPDLAVVRRVGFPVAVANAQPLVKREAAWITSASGGRGAVREFATALLTARGDWDTVVEAYARARDGEPHGE
jgi:3-deoxy-D-manno-octulosonate 8-phosphate phosphatase (KDO 8-P phosphatase)